MSYRFIVIGAGIAGASAAYELAAHSSVLVLERESAPDYHTTGRSAALYSEVYGNATIRALSTASRSFFVAPSPGFTENPLLGPLGLMIIGKAGQEEKLINLTAECRRLAPSVQHLDGEKSTKLMPVLRRDWITGSVYEPGAQHLDVNAIHHGYLRGLKARGGSLRLNSGVRGLDWKGDHWEVETAGGNFSGDIVINAAGAWADELGRLAGARPIGLKPKRRTAAIVPTPPGVDISRWLFVVDLDETFYFKPEAGKLLVSPADETDMPPCDVYPDDYDIAVALDRIGEAADLAVTRVERSWAGLRSFVADRTPVLGYDGHAPNFFWCAGQGGYGIQTAPAMGRATAALALHDPLPPDMLELGLTEDMLSPKRATLSS